MKTDPTSVKVGFGLKLYRTTIDDLDAIAHHSHLKTSDLLRHIINNFIDASGVSKFRSEQEQVVPVMVPVEAVVTQTATDTDSTKL